MKAVKCGFALLEAVVAVAIIGFVSGAVLMTLGAQLRASREVGSALLAAEIGRNRLMMLRLVPPEQLQSLPDSLTAGVEATPSGELWQTSIEPLPDHSDLLEGTIRVTGSGQFVASTYFFRARDAAVGK